MLVIQIRDLGAAEEELESIRGVPSDHEVDAILETSSEVFVLLWVKMIRCAGKKEETKLLEFWR